MSGGTVRSIYARDRGICHLCGRCVALHDASRDHVEPRSRGGYDKSANYRLAHRACNVARGNLPMSAVDGIRERLREQWPHFAPMQLQQALRDAQGIRPSARASGPRVSDPKGVLAWQGRRR